MPDTTAADIHGNQSLSIALWIKPQAPVRSGETLVARWGMGFREDDQYMLHLSDGGHVVFVVSDGSREEWVMSSVPVRADVWQHVAAVFDHAAQRMELFLDGESVGAKAVSISIQSVSVPLRLGQIGAAENAFLGAMDEVRLYNRPLSPPDDCPLCTPDPHFVVHYPLDGSAEDASGNDKHGVLTDVVAVADRHGVPGKACAFNGTSSVVTVPDTTAADIHGNQSLSIALWIKPEAPVRSGETLVARWGMGFREDDQYMLHLSDGGHVVFVVSDGSHEEWVMSSVPIRAGVWQHVAAVFDHAAQRMELFLDGESVGAKAVSINIQSVPVPLRLGQIGAAENAFLGAMDEVRLYNRPLSAQDIRDQVGLARLSGQLPAASATHFQIQVNGIRGAKYRLQTSSDLRTWEDLAVVQVADGPVTYFVPLGNDSLRAGFYRAVALQ
ncbi:MAG: LamG domain-containing protein [Verrucomicrobia bacterium]|nr:LamG domain-containing protein [Verrucomicrobiota bacterium]